MEKTYIFKTKDGLHEFTLRGDIGAKKMEELQNRNPDINVQLGQLLTVITTDFEDVVTLEKEINY